MALSKFSLIFNPFPFSPLFHHRPNNSIIYTTLLNELYQKNVPVMPYENWQRYGYADRAETAQQILFDPLHHCGSSNFVAFISIAFVVDGRNGTVHFAIKHHRAYKWTS